MTSPTRDDVLEILAEVHDPEIPVLNIVEMGIVRDVSISGGRVKVTITPTYSGCPIMNVIGRDVTAALERHGIGGAELETVYAPAWTTDWLTDEARRKLEEYGIAPPKPLVEQPLFGPNRSLDQVACPFCRSERTSLTSEFGSTACKSLHYCNECQQPFEHFKCI
jgi:ring-1,2-phenylacetyl-CoA epoxidase subunit PaaD